MDQILDAKVVLCRCEENAQLYGMLVEKRTPNDWFIKWTFPVSEQRAKSERYDQTVITGNIQYDASYPGCPYCKAPGYYKCVCGNYICLRANQQESNCPVCHLRAPFGGILTTLDAGGDI